MEKLEPMTVSSKERIEVIDIIRGFAILGIFLVNMEDFSSPWLYSEKGRLWTSSLDIGVQSFIDIFAQASFYTLFSFLFGFGMVIFKERAIEKKYSFNQLYIRRLLVLLGFGMIHAFLIWHGDILISYAIIGFWLFLFHHLSPKKLLYWALGFIIIPTLYYARKILLFEMSVNVPISRYNSYLVNKSLNVYGSGSFKEITLQRMYDWLHVNGGDGFIMLTFILLPMFLLGAFIAKKRWFHHPEEHFNEIKTMWKITLILSILFKSSPYLVERNYTLSYLQDTLGGPASALFYATSIILLTRRAWFKEKLSYLAPIGRMSLSNYLFQSIISTLIFYSYGFGLYGKVRPIYGLLLVIIIYIIQIILSNLWLKKFQLGPMEWLWKRLTYHGVQPVKQVTYK